MGTEQLIAFVQNDTNKLVVAVLIFCNEDGLLVGIVWTTTDTDGADIGGCRGILL